MDSINQKIIINIEDSEYLNWKICLKSKLKILKSSYIEIDCKDLDLSCTDISCGLREQIIKSYHPYKYGLRLWDGEKLQALEEVSPLVERLIEPNQSSWLIYPKEIEYELRIEIENLKAKHN